MVHFVGDGLKGVFGRSQTLIIQPEHNSAVTRSHEFCCLPCLLIDSVANATKIHLIAGSILQLEHAHVDAIPRCYTFSLHK
jgi:hypothetical protein